MYLVINKCVTAVKVSNLSGHYLRNRSTLDLVGKPSTLDALIGYFTPSHAIHQRLLLQFLSAPEDGRKKRPKHVAYYRSY